ncbi:MAG: flagellar basal body protein [Oscillospiraceae bacterium]
MRPTFLGFEASKSALFTSQKALDITGNNLSNMSTEGYTRQRVDQVSVSYSNYASKNYLGTRVALAGLGTDTVGVSQTRDKQLDSAFRSEFAQTSGYSQEKTMLSDVESILQEMDIGTNGNGYGLRYAIENLYTSLQDFSLDTSSVTNASVVSSAFDTFASSLRQMSGSLDAKSEEYKSDLQIDTDGLNEKLQTISHLNKSIREAMVVNQYTEEYGPNELLDQRNLLLDQLAAYGELRVTYNENGTVDVAMNGHNCVSGETCDKLEYSDNTDSTISLRWVSDGKDADTGNGIIKVSADIINGRGQNVQSSTESTTRGILYYKDKLNTLAAKMTEIVNNTVPDQVDASGNITSYKAFFGAQTLNADGTTSIYPDLLVTADNIAVTKELSDDPMYILASDGSADNAPILSMVAKLSSQEYSFGDFSGTVEDFISD